MRQRIRSHLTYANVMATLAVFLVLGSGTALASYVVSSNSQVGSGTISGHKPPSGDHSNLIAGSVNGQDVADNSVGGADVNESSLLVSRVIAQPTGGTLSTNGLTTGGQTSYPLSSATFTQPPNEIVEFVSQIKATLATPTNSVNTVCQVRVELNLDGQPLGGQSSPGTLSDQSATKAVATRQPLAVPMTGASSQHTVTATAHLVDHSGEGFSNACSNSSQIDSFSLDVVGTR
jgi:hypothetical protein